MIFTTEISVPKARLCGDMNTKSLSKSESQGHWPIPREVMIAAVNATMQKHPGYCVDKWGEIEAAVCRQLCGEQYRHIETDWIREKAVTLRKAGKLASINGGAKRKAYREPSGEYAAYLKSDHWKNFRLEVLAFWGGRCAICRDIAKDVHHNTYQRIGAERMTDAIPLCRPCHKRVHGAMADYDEKDQDENTLF